MIKVVMSFLDADERLLFDSKKLFSGCDIYSSRIARTSSESFRIACRALKREVFVNKHKNRKQFKNISSYFCTNICLCKSESGWKWLIMSYVHCRNSIRGIQSFICNVQFQSVAIGRRHTNPSFGLDYWRFYLFSKWQQWIFLQRKDLLIFS